MESRGRKVELIFSRIKKHLGNIQAYYDEGTDVTYIMSPIVSNAIRREKDVIVSLARQLMNYQDMFEGLFLSDDDDMF